MAGLLAGAPAQAAPPAAAGQLLVGFERGVTSERQEAVLSALQGRVAKRFGAIRGGRLVLVLPRSGRSTGALRKLLLGNRAVSYAEPDVKFMNSRGKGSTSNAIAGIQYAVKEGLKIINCSFGSSASSSALHDAVDHAQHKDALLVVAAGNDSENIEKNPIYPASYGDSNILAVATSTSSDTLASFLNFGSQSVDLAAPGDSIFSTYLGGGYKVLSGTSMAAPYVAGVAAILRKQESGATYGELRKAVRDRALGAIGSIVD